MGMNNFTTGNGHDQNPNGPGGVPNIGSMLAGLQDDSMTAPEDMLVNYNEKFKNADPTLFRDSVIQQTLGVLIGKNKPNPLLIGPAGVGKTRIVEDIARRLANDDPLIPDKLKGVTIYELPLSLVVSGSSLVGQLEEKVLNIIEFFKQDSTNGILFIDEIHQLSSSTSPTYQKIAQILKPAMARGDISVIGATTTQEAKDLMDDPTFNRRVSKIIVDELTKNQTVTVLTAAKAGFLKHHDYKIAIDDNLLPIVVDLAEQYHPAGSHRPDNALTLLDRAIGDAIVNRKRQEIVLGSDPSQAVALAALKQIVQIPITERQVRQTAIKVATGTSKPELLDVDKLTDALSVIKGQDKIITHLIRELRKHEMNLMPSNQPMTLLFIGPSGVGKTEVTKIIAKELTGCAPIVLNMTEYNSPASVNRIIGSAAGYVGSDSHAELPFDSLESNPYQIILLDEFEKCDDAVQKLFMQVFDEGTLKTNRGTTIDFSRSIIIATTNAGHQVQKNPLGFAAGKPSEVKTDIKDLSASFDIALLNRFKEHITFQPISKEIYRDIIVSRYHRTIAEIRATSARVTLPDDIPDDTLDKMVNDTYVPEFGARPAKKAVEDFIYDQVL